MQALTSGPAPTETGKVDASDTGAHWRTVTAVNKSLGMSPSMTHSLKRTKEHSDSFFAEARQSFLLSCKNVRHTVRGWLFSFSLAQLFSVSLSCIPATLQQHISCVLPLFSFSCGSAIPAFNHDYDASSRPPSAIHSAFLFIPFCTLLLAHTAAQLCQTHVVRPKHP